MVYLLPSQLIGKSGHSSGCGSQVWVSKLLFFDKKRELIIKKSEKMLLFVITMTRIPLWTATARYCSCCCSRCSGCSRCCSRRCSRSANVWNNDILNFFVLCTVKSWSIRIRKLVASWLTLNQVAIFVNARHLVVVEIFSWDICEVAADWIELDRQVRHTSPLVPNQSCVPNSSKVLLAQF